MANEVVVVGESGTLAIQAIATNAGPEMEFRSGSFKGTIDERRVVTVFLAIPAISKDLTLRFEFTDPSFAATDLVGESTQWSGLQTVEPYREPRSTRRLEEGR